MRRVLKKEDLKDPKSLRFLYNTKLGNLLLWLCTRRWFSKRVVWYLYTKLSCIRIKRYIKKSNIDMSQFYE